MHDDLARVDVARPALDGELDNELTDSVAGERRGWLLDQLEDWHEPDQRVFAQALDSFTGELIESGRRPGRV